MKFSILETDGLCSGGLKIHRAAYRQAIDELGFEHKDALDFARDKFREWWYANDKAEPVSNQAFDDWNNS
jgi:hypothetical protein